MGRCAAAGLEAPPDGEARLALECAERNRRKDPANPVFARDLGAVLYHLGRLEEARPLLEEAWKRNSALSSALLHAAAIEHRGGRPERGRELYEEAVTAARRRLPPGSPIARYFEVLRAWADRTLSAPPAGRP